MTVYRDIYDGIASSTPAQGAMVRLLKLQEEAGEVAQAFIGYTGANARKGVTHTETDVAKELCDVVITAMVAMHDFVPDPEAFLAEQLVVLKDRIKREGS